MNKNTRPLVSFIVIAYNQEKYIEEAIRGAFSQTYEPLEIILSDDNSNDGTFEIMKQMADTYCGHHTIVLNKNENNLGLGHHINKVFDMAKGEIIVAAAGDDVSLANRTEEIFNVFNENPNIYSVSSNPLLINNQGNVIRENKDRYYMDLYDVQSLIRGNRTPVNGCTRAYKKEVMTCFTPLKADCPAEDVILLFRAILLGGTLHRDSTMMKYRVLDESLSSKIDVHTPQMIYEQKLKDLNQALSSEYITQKQYEGINNILQDSLHYTIKFQKISHSKLPLLYFIFHVLPSRHIRIDRKKYLLGVAIRMLVPIPNSIKTKLKSILKL